MNPKSNYYRQHTLQASWGFGFWEYGFVSAEM
jgi:hypothetical protein